MTRIGKLELRVPRDREGRFSTELFDRFQRSEKALVSALAEMYVQGVSTRKVKAVTEELCGHTFSASTVSRINKSLDGLLRRFAQRRLDEAYPSLILDARYEKVRLDGVIQSQAVFIAIGINGEGRRQILGVELSNRESRSSWTTLSPEVDGVIYQRHEPGIVRYFTLCGAVDIERWTYREMGVRNGPTLVPLDLDAGLVERTTPGARLPDCPGLREGSHAQLRGGYDGRPPMSALAQHAGTGGQGHRDRGHVGGASHRTAPAAGGAGAGRRRRHLTGPRPHVGAHGGGRPGRRDARDASQDAAYALHTQEASPGECQLPDGLCRHDQLPRRRRNGAGHAPLHRAHESLRTVSCDR